MATDGLSRIVQSNLFPPVSFDCIDNSLADECLRAWGHWLGGCNRPFGRQSFGVMLYGNVISVAVSASTVNARCAGYDRQTVVELARQASEPDHRWATRVCVRLWREVGARLWPYWPVVACVSYANALRHAGDIYRFDGWRKVADVRGGVAGGNWGRGKRYDPKSVWVYEFQKEENGLDERLQRSDETQLGDST
jgi:hypothetical protein